QYENPRMVELFGYTCEQYKSVDGWWPLAYPDPEYREWVSKEWERRLSDATKNQGEIEPMEVTVTCQDGTKKYVRVLAKVINTMNFITFVDLTERKKVEEALRESEARERAKAKELETVLDAVPVPVFVAYDPSCKRITANKVGYEQLRLPKGDNLSKSAPPE